MDARGEEASTEPVEGSTTLKSETHHQLEDTFL